MGWVSSIWKSYQQKSQFCLSSVSLSVHLALMVRPQQSVSISSCDHVHWIATFCCNCPGHHYVHPRGKYNCGTIPQHDHTLENELAANTVCMNGKRTGNLWYKPHIGLLSWIETIFIIIFDSDLWPTKISLKNIVLPYWCFCIRVASSF